MKTLYIIAGCNGAGKTTASLTMLPEIWKCREFVNADEIAKGISPFNPGNVAIEAGKVMLSRINSLLEGEWSFSIETTLSTRSYHRLIRRAHERGFCVQLLFFWLPDPETAIERVEERVREGGHGVAPDVVRRRYVAGIDNLFKIYMGMVDSWMIVENLHNPRIIIADGKREGAANVFNQELFNAIKSYVR